MGDEEGVHRRLLREQHGEGAGGDDDELAGRAESVPRVGVRGCRHLLSSLCRCVCREAADVSKVGAMGVCEQRKLGDVKYLKTEWLCLLTNRGLGKKALDRVDCRNGHEHNAEDDNEKVEEDGSLAERLLEAVVVQQRRENHTHRGHHQSPKCRQRNHSPFLTGYQAR